MADEPTAALENEGMPPEGDVVGHAGARLAILRESLGRLERQDWRLWWTTVIVMFLLLGAVLAVAAGSVFAGHSNPFREATHRNILGLSGLILLFDIYAIYQQFVIKRMRRQVILRTARALLLRQRAWDLRRQAVIDPLTRLYNRRLFDDRLEADVNRSERYGHPLTVLAFDLDNLKEINDTYGHAAGDLALKVFAFRLQSATRGSDVAARVGGDEFLVLLPECDAGHVERVLDRVRTLEITVGEERIPVEFSVGWTEFRRGESARSFLERSDKELYNRKRSRKAGARL